MFLIVGLGNFGKQYENTRHNYGFLLIDKIISRYNLIYNGKKFKSDFYQGEIDNIKIFVIKPETYMNLSGFAVSEAMKFFKIPVANLIVCYDDLDLEVGRIKHKIGGGSGGHNGIKSIDENIGVDYQRIRLGIGKPLDQRFEISDYVLSKFTAEEIPKIDDLNNKIADNFVDLLKGNVANFLNKIYLKK